jgi:hypothetical protein
MKGLARGRCRCGGERLTRPVSIFLWHLSHEGDSSLNGSIQIVTCRVLLDKTGVRPILLGEIPHSTFCHLREHNHRNAGPADRILLGIIPASSEENPAIYLIRLVAYGLIIWGIVEKNREKSPARLYCSTLRET